MSDKPKLWNNPMVVLGLMIALILVFAAVMYFFYTKLAACRAKVDDGNKKINEVRGELAGVRARAETAEKGVTKVQDLEAKIITLESKVKKLKNVSSSRKNVKCEGETCSIEVL